MKAAEFKKRGELYKMMDIQNQPFAVKSLNVMSGSGTLRFDYPIQRASGQWKLQQKSFLIHSLAVNYPIPPVYFLGSKEDFPVKKKSGEIVNELKTVRYVLDGKQRITVIREFLNDEFTLAEFTPEVILPSEEGMTEYEIAGKKFSELDENVQTAILTRNLTGYTIDGETASEDDIADLFFRMNNGSALTTQQKAKALMGIEWAERIQDLGNHILVKELSAFSKTQYVSEGHLTAIIQTMMMLDGSFDYKNVSQKAISDYTMTFQNDKERKMLLVEKIHTAMDYLVEVFSDTEKLLLKKVHFPMTLITALRAKELEVQPEDFRDWVFAFKEAFKPSKKKGEEQSTVTILPTDYARFTGKGTTDRIKADGRMNEMLKHFEEYAKMHNLLP